MARNLKRCPTHKLKGKEAFNFTTGQYDDVVLSGDCADCQILKVPPATGVVWLGDTDTVTLKASGFIPRATLESTIGGVPIDCRVVAGSGNIGDIDVWFRRPHGIFDYRVVVNISANGAIVLNETIPYNPNGSILWEAEISFPVRLMALIRELGLYDYNTYNPWRDNATKDGGTVDLRGFTNVEMGWFYWPNDGPVNLKFSANHGALSCETSSIGIMGPTQVIPGYTYQDGVDFTEKPAWLKIDYWNSPQVDPVENTVWADWPWCNRGAKAWVSADDGKLWMRSEGSTSDARNADMRMVEIQPARRYRFIGDLYDIREHHKDTPVEFTIHNGPDWSGAPTPCNTYVNLDFPVPQDPLDPDAVFHWLKEELPLDYTTPWGKAWDVSATCSLDVQDGVDILDYRVDTIHSPSGHPAFGGFCYNSEDDPACGTDGDRITLQVPSAFSRWDAIRIKHRDDYVYDDLEQVTWQGLDGTRTYTSEGTLRIWRNWYGLPARVKKTYSGEDGIGTVRYLGITAKSMTGSEVDGTLLIGSKSWDFTVTTAGTEAIIDLLAPDNASGYCLDSTKLEVTRKDNPDWGWGVEPNFTAELVFSGEVTLYPIMARNRNTPGFCTVMEAVHPSDERFFLEEVEDGLNTYRHYARRGLLFVPEGRVAFDAEMGVIRAEGDPYGRDLVWSLNSIADMVGLCNEREAGGLYTAQNLRSPSWNISTVNDGQYWYLNPLDFFNNAAYGYHLLPCYKTFNGKDDVILEAVFTADRIECQYGVSCTFNIFKATGGGVHGIILGSDHDPALGKAVTLTDTPDNQDTVTNLQNGLYGFSEEEHYGINLDQRLHQLLGPYPSVPGTDGIRHGVTTRLNAIRS